MARRADRSSIAPAPGMLVVALGDRRLAVPAGQIVEVARIESFTPLPCEDPVNLGVVLHRDAFIPLVDLARRLGARRPGPVGLPTLCLFVETAIGEVSFPVDRVLGLETVSDRGLDPALTVLDPVALGAGSPFPIEAR
jgi:chemotaxis signal transduction protein